MSAEQMFKDLDYKKRIEDGCIKFERHTENVDEALIEFDLDTKTVCASWFMEQKEITIAELRAINKQCEELGWFEEEKQEIKQETNFEHYKDEILENCLESLAVVKGKPKLCPTTNCSDCDFNGSLIGCHKKVADWLKQPHKKPVYKLTKFEKELLQCYPDIYSFKVFNSLNGMKEKGYFKGIDDNELIGDILAKCEVVG